MHKSKARRIQALLTTHLLNCGSIELILPDGVRVEIDITKISKKGREIKQDYCHVTASREDVKAHLDSYLAGLEYADGRTLMTADGIQDESGRLKSLVEVV